MWPGLEDFSGFLQVKRWQQKRRWWHLPFKGMLKQKRELGRIFGKKRCFLKRFFLVRSNKNQLISKCWTRLTWKRWLKWQLLTRKSIKSSWFWSVDRYQLPSKEDSLNLHVGMTRQKRDLKAILFCEVSPPHPLQKSKFFQEHPNWTYTYTKKTTSIIG